LLALQIAIAIFPRVLSETKRPGSQAQVSKVVTACKRDCFKQSSSMRGILEILALYTSALRSFAEKTRLLKAVTFLDARREWKGTPAGLSKSRSD
jgi:hypothetical protein